MFCFLTLMGNKEEQSFQIIDDELQWELCYFGLLMPKLRLKQKFLYLGLTVKGFLGVKGTRLWNPLASTFTVIRKAIDILLRRVPFSNYSIFCVDYTQMFWRKSMYFYIHSYNQIMSFPLMQNSSYHMECNSLAKYTYNDSNRATASRGSKPFIALQPWAHQVLVRCSRFSWWRLNRDLAHSFRGRPDTSVLCWGGRKEHSPNQSGSLTSLPVQIRFSCPSLQFWRFSFENKLGSKS